MDKQMTVNQEKQKRMKMISTLCSVMIIILFLVCETFLFYPWMKEYHDRREVKTVITNYDTSVTHMDAELKADILAKAQEYNQRLLENPIGFEPTEEELEEYNQLLDPNNTGIMGYITIPCIDVALLIYHTVEEPVLQTAIGHMPGSSLPVGGDGTHAILSGHTGLPTPLFTNLDKMKEGDVFFLTVLEDVLTYEVDDIQVVLPYEMETLRPEKGKDYCTLVTCTPFGVNSHRLLVRGRRIETPTQVEEGGAGSYETSEMVERETSRLARIYAMCGLVILVAGIIALTMILIKKHRKHKQGTEEVPLNMNITEQTIHLEERGDSDERTRGDAK